jgi:hypothetical protein
MKLVPRRLLLAPFVAMGSFAAIAACWDDSVLPPAADAAASTAEDASDATDVPASDGGPMCALPGVYGSPQCNRCMATKCCGKIGACVKDPECAQLQQCALHCLPETDSSGCYLTNCEPHFSHDAEALFLPVGDCQYGTPQTNAENPDATCVVECSPPVSK